MEKLKDVLLGLGVMVVLIIAILSQKSVNVTVVNPQAQDKMGEVIGTDLSINPSTDSYSDSGADVRQNVQAMAERMAGLTQYQILQADSAGKMQAVLPSAATWSDVAMTGSVLTSPVRAGSIASFTTNGTSTAANVCDNPLWNVTAASAAITVTLPSTTTLFADCLDTNGDTVSFLVLNGSGTTSTVFAAGTGGTLTYSASTTIAAGKTATVDVVRSSATAYKALLTNQAN